jgi:hypothetical protein
VSVEHQDVEKQGNDDLQARSDKIEGREGGTRYQDIGEPIRRPVPYTGSQVSTRCFEKAHNIVSGQKPNAG